MKENKIVKPSDRGRLELAVQNEVERVLSVNPKITPIELKRNILNTLRERGVVEEVKKGWFWDTKKKTTAASLAPAEDPSPRVHPTVRDSIRRARPGYTESQINGVIQKLIDNGIDVSQPR